MEVTLNELEQRMAKFTAKQRHQQNRADGVHNGKIGPQSDEATDLEGIAAEIAFCKIMNVYPDTEICAAGEKPVADAATTQLGSVDIKATKYRNGHLVAVKGKARQVLPDTYALMIGEFPTYRFVGYAPAEQLIDDANIKEFHPGKPTYALPQEKLSQMDLFLKGSPDA